MEPMNESDRITIIPDSEKPFLGREWDQDHIDVGLVKTWICDCRKLHLGCEETILPSDEAVVAHFKLIDVLDMCIVDASIDTEYLTLSYVWGTTNNFLTTTENITRLREPGALSELEGEIPATIWDAIVLVSRLSFRYLWIDSLCIVQDDARTKIAAINAMDVIYSRSLCTIVAASGNGAHSGLNGVKQGSRNEKQNVEVVKGLKLMSITHLDDYFSTSVYDTRAWTFQERHLSNRILFLVGGQAIYQCQVGMYREDITSDLTVAADGLEVCENYRLSKWTEDSFVQYMGLVHHYSTRQLSYDGDVLNAFTGVSKVLSTMLETTFHWGLPVSLFDWALLWEAKGYIARRPNCPSWSWTGWKGTGLVRSASFQEKDQERRGHTAMPTEDSIDGNYTFEDLQQWLSDHTWIVWYHYKGSEGSEGTPVPISNPSSGPMGRNDRFFGLDCFRTLPVTRVPGDLQVFPQQRQQGPASPPTPGLGRDALLHFWTVSACFRLGDLPDDYELDELAIGAGLRCYGLYDKDSVVSGDVWTCDDWMPSSNGICQLLIVSEALPFYCEYEEYRLETYEANMRRIRGDDDDGECGGRAQGGELCADDSITDVEEGSETGSEAEKEDVQAHAWHLFNVFLVQPVANSHDLPLVERVGHGKLFRDALSYACDPGYKWEEVILA
ncbi:hypothetical protein MMC22_011993 [Neofusicoccum parvum]|uniref:Uncharacterized protein n=1 Tax=Neofusicoccum parvum TaxID=310453 RepID=A0ACB5SE13_9PEZI|nr:hypothetical protein MMC22_011993 [Neofusicoccum parvum]